MTPVKSSVIAAVGHDGGRLLTVQFHNGEIHKYAGVHKAMFDAMLNARSVGRYFTHFIRPHYHSTKVS
jgi:hypothetical protein